MRAETRSGGGASAVCAGLVAGISAGAVLFVLVDSPFISLGVAFVAGVVLMLPERTWLLGVGFLAGAAVSFAGAAVIGILSVVQHAV